MSGDHDDPFPPRPLEYRRPGIEPPSRPKPYYPVPAQFVVGFIAWVLAEFAWAMTLALPRGSVTVVWTSGLVVLVGLGCLGANLHLRHGWTGFLPGLGVALTLTCVIPGAFLWYSG